jgi:bifunctional non-homologous end joining protein LigD
MSLTEYKRKRDFRISAEPAGTRLRNSGKNRFVIQKHAASRLHYDFRLEMDGTLKSWAVPKGVPYLKDEKRLAVEVEDHPVDYIDFEGIIPAGQYGGGSVMVWDRGTYEPLGPAPAKDLAAGKLHFVLHGKKFNGEWYLVRLRDGKQWLLIKGGKNHRPISAKLDDSSAASGRTMRQLGESNQVWQSKKGAPVSVPSPTKSRSAKRPRSPRPATPSGRTRSAIGRTASTAALAFIEPMKARLVDQPLPGDWVYEIKFDGYRALAIKERDNVRLLSRNEKSFNEKFPAIVDSVAALDAEEAIIDGEIVALDAQGRSSFQLLQAFELNEKQPPLFYCAFDLLRLNGKDLRGQPAIARKAILEKLIHKGSGWIRFSTALTGDVAQLLKQARRLDLEGLIGKRTNSPYEPGRRSGAWIKLKLQQRQEAIIGGYTSPRGSRRHFGALLLGYYQNQKLLFAGKVGTGFDDKLLRELHARFEPLAIETCPFANLPEDRTARHGQGLTLGETNKCHWLRPLLVCEVEFAQWTRDGKLRQPVFLGLRDDKSPAEVIRERPANE